MSLRLFAFAEGLPTLYEIDDPTMFDDAGTAVTARLESHPIDFGPARGFGRLRQCVQYAGVQGKADVTITPVADGVEDTTQAHVSAVDVVNGIEQSLEAPFALPGSRFSVNIVVTNSDALFELGECDVTVKPRRSLTGAGL